MGLRALALAVASLYPVANVLTRLEVPRRHVEAGGEVAAPLGMVEVTDRAADESSLVAPLHRNNQIGQAEIVIGGDR